MTRGKIERWHRTLTNRILLENYYLPGNLEAQIESFVADYNHRRYHESIDNLTRADVYFGRGPDILAERQRIKRSRTPPCAMGSWLLSKSSRTNRPHRCGDVNPTR
jgi:transposase InsO family protein